MKFALEFARFKGRENGRHVPVGKVLHELRVSNLAQMRVGVAFKAQKCLDFLRDLGFDVV